MDWQLAITHNREALHRIVAALCVMAGLAENATLETLPRHLRNHLLRILRPAESAARRLIVMAATGARQQRAASEALKGGTEVLARQQRAASEALKGGTEVLARQQRGASEALKGGTENPARGMEGASAPLSPGGVRSVRSSRPIDNDLSIGAPNARSHSGGPKANPSPTLPLFDPLKRFDAGKKYSKSFPRISFVGLTEPYPLPPVPTLDDPVAAERLCRRLQALQRALDDLDGQANRYARWRARQDLASRSMQDGFTPAGATGQRLAAYDKENQQRPIPYVRERRKLKGAKQKYRRLTPFRPGWPPGYHKRKLHEVDDVLADCHALALLALNPPDTS